jgi:two-component system sensor histidine kinase HydH
MVREFDKKMPQVPLDGDKIKQALLNLVSNALDAMPDGGVLTVGTRQTAGTVIIEISDTGTGISPGVNVFELFFTTKSQGTGMGLNIVEGIVQQHGGHVEFSSVEGEGTTVSIDLPLDVSPIT